MKGERHKDVFESRYFIDKSLLIEKIISAMTVDNQRYLCITRPRRFGKSVMANMLGAFFEKSVNGRAVFDHLHIAQSDDYLAHLNRHDIIYIDFSRLPKNCRDYESYISRIQDGINRDLAVAFPDIKLDSSYAVWDNLQTVFEETQCRFIFIMDEWDAIFHKDFITEGDRKNYLEFLRDLLNGQAYVELSYMTGILPIAKYSGGSEINMFKEYDMAVSEMYSEYFGFLESEVDILFHTYQQTTKNPRISRQDLRIWYDGYHTAAGEQLYNPRSVIVL